MSVQSTWAEFDKLGTYKGAVSLAVAKAAALALALESYELGVAAGLEQIAPTGTATRAITRWEQDPIAMGRAEVEHLAQGKPPVDIWAAERGET